jgi:uncharacterized DUF497 family protein
MVARPSPFFVCGHADHEGTHSRRSLERSTPLVVVADVGHSEAGARLFALGRTDAGRLLTIVFTVRGSRIRVISARAMSKTERTIYGQAKAETHS